MVPAQFRVIVTRRPKYACRVCEDGVRQVEAPARLIEGGLLTEATVAQVLVSKYADHLPRYRRAQIYARQGIALDRSTLADWVGHAAFHLRPLHELAALRSGPSCSPTRRRCRCSISAGARQDRPALGLCRGRPALGRARSTRHRLHLAPDRKSERLFSHLAGFKGVLQVDGYVAYPKLADRGEVELAFCWVHTRRNFYELAAAAPRRSAARC